MAKAEDMLGNVPLFSQLKDKDRKRLVKRLADRRFDQGEEIATEGESGVGFFVIEEGSAHVSRGGETIRTLGPGEYFGEIALIDGGPRSATVVAATELRCRGMTAWDFKAYVTEHGEVAWPLLEGLAARLRDAEARAQS
jgi:CRP/FNR family cyclic AMP-dependent transcriptional regulator